MRNGNFVKLRELLEELFVLTVPMRNGNVLDTTNIMIHLKVLTVPMRNGNYSGSSISNNSSRFLPYL